MDNTHVIENYLEIANKAYNADNYAEAEFYCDKILEIDPKNCEAWLLIGKVAGRILFLTREMQSLPSTSNIYYRN